MNANQCRQRLSELLQAQNDRISRANKYLVELKNAIADNQLDKLQQSLESPDLAIEDIENLEQQRYQLLASFDFEQNAEGLEKCIAWCDNEHKQLSELNRQLVQNLLDLRQSIQLNSLLVTRGQERVRRSIGILTGAGTPTNCKTYSSKGEAINPSSRRGIAVA